MAHRTGAGSNSFDGTPGATEHFPKRRPVNRFFAGHPHDADVGSSHHGRQQTASPTASRSLLRQRSVAGSYAPIVPESLFPARPEVLPTLITPAIGD